MKEYYSYSELGKTNGPGCNIKEQFYENDESTIKESFAIPKEIPGMKGPLGIKEPILEFPKSSEEPSEEPEETEAPEEGPHEVLEEAEESTEVLVTPDELEENSVANESTNVNNVNVMSSGANGYRSGPRYLYSPIRWLGTLVGIKKLDRPQFKFSALIFLVLFGILITMLVKKN